METQDDHDHAALTFRLPADLRSQLMEAAKRHDRSVAAEVRTALRAHVQAERDAASTGAIDRGASTTTVEGAA